MAISLYEHQKKAIKELRSGSILCGGVGTGKSRTALAYFYFKECEGDIAVDGFGSYKPMKHPKDLYIITTARKRDTKEWEKECAPFIFDSIKVKVDSWNNIEKYVDVKDAFFIFDEQRVVGYGVWVQSFIKISKSNHWILLSATPGDTWMDYVPVFIANGFFKNKTDFVRKHVVYDRFSKYPKVDYYVGTNILKRYRDKIVVNMSYTKLVKKTKKDILVSYDESLYGVAKKARWNPYTNKPIKDIVELCYTLRKIVNSDTSRAEAIKDIFKDHKKLIIFYNFDYELEILRGLKDTLGVAVAEWNGHKHEPIPKTKKWLYLVQYAAGAEGWNCIETDTIIFYSQNYSYKSTVQAAGRIDRINTPFQRLYYYMLVSNASIDISIKRALDNKKNFNEKTFAKNSHS
jgi:hypothetical protein